MNKLYPISKNETAENCVKPITKSVTRIGSSTSTTKVNELVQSYLSHKNYVDKAR